MLFAARALIEQYRLKRSQQRIVTFRVAQMALQGIPEERQNGPNRLRVDTQFDDANPKTLG